MKRQRKISILLLSLFLSYGPINSLLLGKNLSVYQQEDQDYSVIVNLKLIQVFVTDKDGNPILDLTKSDFILRDNGKVQNITDFEKHELGKISLLPEERSEPEISSRMNRKFLILLDILGNDNVGVIQSKEAAIHFVETQLLPWDEVGIISYAPLTGLNIHTYFTTDRKRIIDAIKNAKEVAETKWEGPSMEQVRDQSVADAFNKPRSSGGGSQGFGGDSMVTSQFVRPFRDPGLSNIKKNPVHLIMDISELSKTLRYIPGVKHILFFSGGGHQKLQKFYLRLGMELML